MPEADVLEPSGGRRTVLIADDDDAMRTIVSAVLSADGYDVVEVADGATALEILARAADGERPTPDVLLLDFCMPGLSGIGVLRMLRRFGKMPPTVLMTGFPDRSVEALARGVGATHVLRKPVGPDEVRAAIHAALGQRS